MSEPIDSVEQLKSEVERLTLELDQTVSEKNQAAQYGLVLLEEKESLQTRLDDLELHYENTKHELDNTREVSGEGCGHLLSCRTSGTVGGTGSEVVRGTWGLSGEPPGLAGDREGPRVGVS